MNMNATRAKWLAVGAVSMTGALGLSACGQGGDGTVSLDVQMLSVSGSIEGNDLAMETYSVSQGERLGDHGTFLFDGPGTSVQVSACPLDNTNIDPYGATGGPPVTSMPDPSGEPVRPTPPLGCTDRSIFVCAGNTCGSFSTDEVELELVDQGQWRHLVMHGESALGSVDVELQYREQR